MILFLTYCSVPIQSLSFLTQVLKIILPLLLHIFIYIPTPLRKLFIILLVSLLLKLNYLLSDVISIKLFSYLKFSALLLSLIQSIQHIRSLICLFIYTNNNWLLFPKIFSHSSTNIHQIPLNSGIAQVVVNSFFIHWLIKKPRNSTLHYYFHAKHYGILTRRMNALISSETGEWFFKCPISKANTSWSP